MKRSDDTMLEDAGRPLPLLPWHGARFARLQNAATTGRLPAALLVHEAPGTGGGVFARRVAQLALCRNQPAPCGECRDCRWVAADRHPDLHLVQIEADRAQIRVEQIRELIGELQLTSHERNRRVALIEPADAMNTAAANALLKTLEEPAGEAHLILVTTVPSQLPATVRSRCLRLTIDPPARDTCLAWLDAADPGPDWSAVLDIIGNAPLAAPPAEANQDAPEGAGRFTARDLLECHRETGEALRAAARGTLEIAQVAERWSRQHWLPMRLRCIETWITTWLEQRLRAAGQGRELQTTAHLRGGDSELNIHSLARMLEQARECGRQLSLPLNKALGLEQLFWLARSVER